MNIYQATAKGPLKIPGYIDPDDVTTIQVFWGAPVFQASHVYRLGDICRPTVDNGYQYEVTTPGKSAATEPTTWGQSTQTSGTAKFTASAFDQWVKPEESLSSSTWEVTEETALFQADKDYLVGDTCRPTVSNGYYYVCKTAGNVGPTEPGSWSLTEQTIGTAVFDAVLYVTIATPLNDNESTSINVTAVSKTLASFKLTNQVQKSTGDKLSRTFLYKVREQ